MNIFFDYELSDDPNIERPIPSRQWVYDEVREFIRTRYNVLDDDLRKLETDSNVPFIVLSWKDDKFEYYYQGIPEELKKKLFSCVSESDFTYITNVLSDKIKDEDIEE